MREDAFCACKEGPACGKMPSVRARRGPRKREDAFCDPKQREGRAEGHARRIKESKELE